MRGIDIGTALLGTDELRSRIRLAGLVEGNIGLPPGPNGERDQIHVGRIVRLEARLNNTVTPQAATGNIRANIRTSSPWQDDFDLVGGNILSIGVISADSGIDSTVIAGSRPRKPDPNGGFIYPSAVGFNPGTIRRISVENDFGPDALGLVGATIITGAETAIAGGNGDPDVFARQPGSLMELYSAGKFGTAARPVTLDIGNNLVFVRAVARSGNKLVLGNQDIHANISVGGWIAPAPVSGSVPNATLSFRTLSKLETGGSFFGSLNLGNLRTLPLDIGEPNGIQSSLDAHIPQTGFSPLGHSGLHVRGTINAPITIQGVVEYADIIAERILQPIIIGSLLKGSVIAYGEPTAQDPGAGSLHSIRVGRDPQIVGAEASLYLPGFCGVDSPPIDLNPYNRTIEERWFQPESTDLGGASGVVFPVGGADDAVIRAFTAGPINVAAMSSFYLGVGGTTKSRPRIEVRSAESINVGIMLAGAVWSGALEYNPEGVENDPTNDYATTSLFQADCLGSVADVWMQSTPLIFVDGDVRGQIRTPWLESDHSIVIGGTLAPADTDPASGFGCNAPVATAGLGGVEQSPRDIQAGADEPFESADFGAIYIRDPLGLAGQITLEANNTTAVHDTSRLAGFVRVGGFLPGQTVVTLATANSLAAGTTAASILPFYALNAAQLGGGAVGVVPFAVHLADSPAVTGADSIFPPFILPTALRISGLPLRYYGPVVMTVPQPTGTITSRGNGTFGPFLPPNSGQDFTGSAAGRTMTLIASQSSQIFPLEYQAIPDTFGVRSLVTLPTGLVTRNTLADKAVYYRVGCGFGGNPNPADVTGIGGPPAAPDNQVTGDDFNAFIAAFAAEDLLADITGIGGPPALPDGLITGDDFNAFIAAFIAGCEQ
jgi:hypothetical protein